jgi:site-specific recombinase XerC
VRTKLDSCQHLLDRFRGARPYTFSPSIRGTHDLTFKKHIRELMRSARDAHIINLWLETQRSLHTRGCYRSDSERLLNHAKKALPRITLGDLQSFAQSLIDEELAPVSRVRTLAAVKSLFGFCGRIRYLPTNPAAELELPSYEKRLAERIVEEEDVQRMLEAEAAPRDRVLARLLYGAGLRVSEACGLRLFMLWPPFRWYPSSNPQRTAPKQGGNRACGSVP